MARIPLEDNFNDILAKAQRGLKLSDEELAQRAGVSVSELAQAKSGTVLEGVIRKLAKPLSLGEAALADSAKQAWYPRPQQVDGLAQFNTPWQDMTVNTYVLWDSATKDAAVFDSGATCAPALEFVKTKGLRVKLILLTHTHPDHIADLDRLKRETSAPVFVGEREPHPATEPFAEGRVFQLGGLKIETRRTSGHSVGGITYVISGLARTVAVVGDALFAGSMGGGLVSYPEALENNRKKIFSLAGATVLAPGHGPLTTVGEEKEHNPFYPEFQKH
jgi:glyoxylase-like metal-dependent hydrolase (beta-lactamase superfamily II)